MLSTENFNYKLPDVAKVTIIEYLEDEEKIQFNCLNRQFYDEYLPQAMTCKENLVRKGVEHMLKEYSQKYNIDLSIDHFIRVSEYFGVTRPVLKTYITEFKTQEIFCKVYLC